MLGAFLFAVTTLKSICSYLLGCNIFYMFWVPFLPFFCVLQLFVTIVHEKNWIIVCENLLYKQWNVFDSVHSKGKQSPLKKQANNLVGSCSLFLFFLFSLWFIYINALLSSSHTSSFFFKLWCVFFGCRSQTLQPSHKSTANVILRPCWPRGLPKAR